MSVFDDEVRVGTADIFRDAGDPGDYQGAVTAPDIMVVLERDFEVYDDNQIAMRVITISVLIADVAESRQGDTIATNGRTWTVQQVLTDDGHVRRLWVS